MPLTLRRTLVASLVLAAPLLAADEPQTKVVTIGARYQASGLHRLFLGADYRDLWAKPVKLEVLDLHAFAGGLTPVKRVGGEQTKGLAMKGKDGRDWTFRGIDKDPTSILPPDLEGTIAERVVQDQIAGSQPAGYVVADSLLDAAGVLHASQRLVVMPDDPALGEFRAAFAGLAGTLEEYPGAVSATNPGFHGALEILNHDKFYARMLEGPETRPDAQAFLAARLMDVFMGDWDRHRKQWRWAKIPGKAGWQPIPEDRDQAFSRYEGLVLGAARQAQPRFVVFGPSYPSITGLTFNGWEQDRQLLADLEWSAWQEVARDLQARLSDAVIDAAVRRMPDEYQKLDGARLASALKKRRDGLAAEARHYYEHVADRVNVHLTDLAENVEIEGLSGGALEVRVAPRRADGSADVTYYRRRFDAADTQELRLYLHGGDDRIVTSGSRSPILVRVVGGTGNDVLDNAGSFKLRFSDDQGANRVLNRGGAKVLTNAYVPPPPEVKAPWIPPRDWGHQTITGPVLGYAADEGALVGFKVQRDAFAFRKDPYASWQQLSAAFAIGANRARVTYDGDFRLENSGVRLGLSVRASGVDSLNFYGFGNDSPDNGSARFYRIREDAYQLAPSVSFPLAPRLRFGVGPILKYTTTGDDADRFLATQRPLYGKGNFGEAGVRGTLRLDTRDRTRAPSRGVLVEMAGSYYPKVWDVKSSFGEAHGSAAGYLSLGGYLQPTFAVRAGGKRVWGIYPFHEAAYIGGTSATGEGTTVRGFRANRFAGDSSVYGNAELRLFLTKFFLLFPGELGVFALGDAGRVYLDGETSDTWHTGVGGGVWLDWIRRDYTLTISVVSSDQRTALYVHAGFAF